MLGGGRMWDAAKNAAALCAAGGRCAWPVAIAGADGADAPDGVRLLGHLTFADLAVWLARAAIYAAPARYEPFGLGILEAAMSGCALVLGDIPSLRELWDDAAVFVDPDDHGALSDALDRLAASPAERAQLAGAATVRARRYGVDVSGAAYAAEYRQVVERAGAHA